MSRNTHSGPKTKAVSHFAENLLRPVEFASKDDYQKIDTVRGLGATASKIVDEMKGALDFQNWVGDVTRLGKLFSDYDSKTTDEKRSTLREAGKILKKIISANPKASGKLAAALDDSDMKPSFNLSESVERLNTPVTFVKGVGPKRAKVFEKKGVKTVEDLLYYFPKYYINIRGVKTIKELRLKERAALVVEVVVSGEKFTSRRRFKRISEVVVTDGTDLMTLVWFNIPYMKGRYKVGMRLLVTGVVSEFNRRKSMAHPDVEPWDGWA